MNDFKSKSLILIKLGIALVAGSYLLLIPTFAFAALSIGPRTVMWGKLAVATYILSWILFIAGFIAAGPEAARIGRRWIIRLFTRKNKIPTETPLHQKDDVD